MLYFLFSFGFIFLSCPFPSRVKPNFLVAEKWEENTRKGTFETLVEKQMILDNFLFRGSVSKKIMAIIKLDS